MTLKESIQAQIHENLFDLQTALTDLADLASRLATEIDERGSQARLPQNNIVGERGTRIDQHAAIIHALRGMLA